MKPTPFHPTFPRAAVGVLLAAAVLASAGALVAERPGAAPPTAAEHEAAVAWCRIRTLRQETGLQLSLGSAGGRLNDEIRMTKE